MDLSKYITVPLTELTTPRDGRVCMCDRWWLVTDGDEAPQALFYKHYTSPQCNRDKSVVEHIRPAGTHAVFVPVAYVKHSCRDYV